MDFYILYMRSVAVYDKNIQRVILIKKFVNIFKDVIIGLPTDISHCDIIDYFSGPFGYIQTMFLLNWLTAQPSFASKN
jgi:hypothetical protein